MVLPTANTSPSGYQTSLVRWSAPRGAFGEWSFAGTLVGADGTLQLDPAAARADADPYGAGQYLGRSYYNGGSFIVGEATSPEGRSPFAFHDAIVSWNAETPDGTWLEAQLRVLLSEGWSRWYSLGVWASGASAVERHSVGDQDDDAAAVAVDTLTTKRPALGYQVRLRLFSVTTLTPRVQATGVALSSKQHYTATPAPGSPSLWNRILPVPLRSQMLFPNGGNVWCGPVSLSMVQAYWRARRGSGQAHAVEAGPAAEHVHAAVAGCYDWCYAGHGNWAFNVAYAALEGLEAYAARLPSLAAAEPWIAAGVPLVISYRWREGELQGAAVPTSNGHLGVLVGFDADGNPVLNDPAASDDATVRRTYRRDELESIWLRGSGGLAYLIYPPGWETPDAA